MRDFFPFDEKKRDEKEIIIKRRRPNHLNIRFNKNCINLRPIKWQMKLIIII